MSGNGLGYVPVGNRLPYYGGFKMKRVPISARIPASDYATLQKIASDTNRTLSEVMCEAIARYLGHRGAGAKTRSRIDQMQQQLDHLTLLIAGGTGGDRHTMAQRFLEQISPRD